MLVVLTETYCNKVNIQITQRDDFIQIQQMHVSEINVLIQFLVTLIITPTNALT